MVGFHFLYFFGPDVSVFAFFCLAVLERLKNDFLEVLDIELMWAGLGLVIGVGLLRDGKDVVGFIFHWSVWINL